MSRKAEVKSSLRKLKVEVFSGKDDEKGTPRKGRKGHIFDITSLKDRFGKMGDRGVFRAYDQLKDRFANGNGNNGDEEETENDYFEKKDDRYMHPLPLWARFTTNHPMDTIIVVGIITLALLFQAIAIDFEAWGEGKTGIGSKLNIRGEMEVYLPSGHESADILKKVREYWSTDIILVYVEIDDPDNNKVNMSDRSVLKQMSFVEESVDPYKTDRGEDDGVVFCLSISTLVKEINSTGPRIFDATVSNLGDLVEDYLGIRPPDSLAINATEQAGIDMLGTYDIPEDDQRINSTVRQMPDNVRKKVVEDTNGDGIWDAGVIVIGINDGADPGKMISAVDTAIENSYREADIGKNVIMTNTGPVTLTDMITEQAFVYYGKLMPVAMALVTLAIMIFHRSLKAVFIAGIPTGCSIVWIYGLLAMFRIEVTPTIILLGPVLLALGVSYGIHLANRIAQEPSDDPKIRAQVAIRTTGRAVLMSAITTMIGFVSLGAGDLKPVTTVGLSLTAGIGICYLLTMLLAPSIAILVDYRKKAGEGAAKKWKKISEFPVNHSMPIIAAMIFFVIISVMMLPLIKTDTDVLSMAPDDENVDGVDKIIAIKDYSENFNSGALGMVLVETEGRHTLRTSDYRSDNQDPMVALHSIDDAEQAINRIQDPPLNLPVNAISIVSIMKLVGASAYVDVLSIPLIGEIVYGVTGLNINVTQSTNFWELITNTAVENVKPLQKFLLNVFYDSLSEESRGMVINQYRDKDSSDYYTKTLIYVDMPILTDEEVHDAVFGVNQVTEDYSTPSDGIRFTKLTGVAAIAVAINDGLIESQKLTLVLSILLVMVVLTAIFWDREKKAIQNIALGVVTTLPVILTVALEPLFMVTLDISLNLATVMIGSTVIGAGVDFSVHITQRSMEGGMSRKSIMNAVEKSGMGLFEATVITILGLMSAILPYVGIPIPAIFSFILLIMILLAISAVASIFVLPAILYILFVRKHELEYEEEMQVRQAEVV